MTMDLKTISDDEFTKIEKYFEEKPHEARAMLDAWRISSICSSKEERSAVYNAVYAALVDRNKEEDET